MRKGECLTKGPELTKHLIVTIFINVLTTISSRT